MRKVLLLFVFILGCLQVNAQKLTPKFLKGTWETEFHTIEFKGDNKKDFSIIITLKQTGENVEVLNWVFDKNNLYTETYYSPNDFKSVGKLIFVDENTLVEDVTSDHSGLLIYKRKSKY